MKKKGIPPEKRGIFRGAILERNSKRGREVNSKFRWKFEILLLSPSLPPLCTISRIDVAYTSYHLSLIEILRKDEVEARLGEERVDLEGG